MTAPPDDTTTDTTPSSPRCGPSVTRHWQRGRAGRGTRCARRCTGQRNSEYGERIEHQAATIDVLKAMSASPGDRTAGVRPDRPPRARTVRCGTAAICLEFDGELVHFERVVADARRPQSLDSLPEIFPSCPTRGSITWPGDPGSSDRSISETTDADPDLHRGRA